MKCNVGKTDRMFRIILGVIIILAGIDFKSWWPLLALFIFVAELVLSDGVRTDVPFALSTCKEEKDKKN